MRKLLIVLAAFAFVVAYTVPAMADDEWDFYGSARILTFSTDKSKETTTWGTTDDIDLTNDFSGSARVVGAKVKAGDIGGRLELGGTVNLRLAYGTWNFGAGTLVVGHDYSPANFFPSGMVYNDNSMVSYGAPYAGRHPQVKLKIVGLQVALVQPKVVSASALTKTDTDTSMPKIELSYSLKAGPVALYFFGGMNSHDDVVVQKDAAGEYTTTEKTYSIDSNVFGVGFKVPVGPLYINGAVWMSKNPGNYGMLQDRPTYKLDRDGDGVKETTLSTNGAIYDPTADKIEDCDSTVMALVVGYKISDMIKLEGGYGVISSEFDTVEAETTFMYVQVPITLAKNVTLTPEVGTMDYGDVEDSGALVAKQGDKSYIGLRWRINF